MFDSIQNVLFKYVTVFLHNILWWFSASPNVLNIHIPFLNYLITFVFVLIVIKTILWLFKSQYFSFWFLFKNVSLILLSMFIFFYFVYSNIWKNNNNFEVLNNDIYTKEAVNLLLKNTDINKDVSIKDMQSYSLIKENVDFISNPNYPETTFYEKIKNITTTPEIVSIENSGDNNIILKKEGLKITIDPNLLTKTYNDTIKETLYNSDGTLKKDVNVSDVLTNIQRILVNNNLSENKKNIITITYNNQNIPFTYLSNNNWNTITSENNTYGIIQKKEGNYSLVIFQKKEGSDDVENDIFSFAIPNINYSVLQYLLEHNKITDKTYTEQEYFKKFGGDYKKYYQKTYESFNLFSKNASQILLTPFFIKISEKLGYFSFSNKKVYYYKDVSKNKYYITTFVLYDLLKTKEKNISFSSITSLTNKFNIVWLNYYSSNDSCYYVSNQWDGKKEILTLAVWKPDSFYTKVFYSSTSYVNSFTNFVVWWVLYLLTFLLVMFGSFYIIIFLEDIMKPLD